MSKRKPLWIPEDLHWTLKRKAAEQRMTLKELVIGKLQGKEKNDEKRIKW